MKLLTRPRFWQREMIPMGPLFVTRPALHAWLLFGNAGKKDLYFVNILDPLVVATRPMRQCHSKLQSKVCFHRQLARTSPPLYKIVQLRFGMTPPNHPMAGSHLAPINTKQILPTAESDPVPASLTRTISLVLELWFTTRSFTRKACKWSRLGCWIQLETRTAIQRKPRL
jgi:hypothetical protein